MPPPGPCDASAALLHNAAAIEVAAGTARDIAARVRNDVMENLHTEGAVEDTASAYARFGARENLKAASPAACVHLRGAFIQDPFKSRTSDCMRRCDSAQT
jgi:hypothetical protein